MDVNVSLQCTEYKYHGMNIRCYAYNECDDKGDADKGDDDKGDADQGVDDTEVQTQCAKCRALQLSIDWRC